MQNSNSSSRAIAPRYHWRRGALLRRLSCAVRFRPAMIWIAPDGPLDDLA